MYILLECSDNCADSSASLYQFKRDEKNMNNGNLADVTTDDSSSFKYKSSPLGNPNVTGVLRNAKIVVPIKYLSNLVKSLEMPFINCKIYLELNWTNNCVVFFPIVTLSFKDDVNLTKQLNG